MTEIFQISQRHYDIITNQAMENLPRESGGFLGGLKGVIRAILPLQNKQAGDQTAKFGIDMEDDVNRAIRFFHKHKLDYFGAYHSHPNGIAYPSKQDLIAGQKVENCIKSKQGVYHYHFIIGAKKDHEPVLASFKVVGKTVVPIPIQIISNASFSVVDIHTGEVSQSSGPKTMQEEAELLTDQMDNIINNRPNKYKRMDPKSGYEASDFSTFA